MSIDQLFWWTGAVVAWSACALIVLGCLVLLVLAIEATWNAWFKRAIAIYQLASVRYYLGVMVKNGRAGLLAHVEQSRVEAERAQQEQPQ